MRLFAQHFLLISIHFFKYLIFFQIFQFEEFLSVLTQLQFSRCSSLSLSDFRSFSFVRLLIYLSVYTLCCLFHFPFFELFFIFCIACLPFSLRLSASSSPSSYKPISWSFLTILINVLLFVVDCFCCCRNHLSAARHSIRYLFVQLLVDGVRQVDNITLNILTHTHTHVHREFTPPYCFAIFICFACQ